MSGKFPTIEIMCEYGLFENPVAIFESYKDLTKKEKVPVRSYFECETCGFYSFTKKCSCVET